MSIRGPPPAKQTASTAPAPAKKWGTVTTNTPSYSTTSVTSTPKYGAAATQTAPAPAKKWGTVATNTPSYGSSPTSSSPKLPAAAPAPATSTTTAGSSSPRKFGANATGHTPTTSTPTNSTTYSHAQSSPRSTAPPTASSSPSLLSSSPTTTSTTASRPVISTPVSRTPSASISASMPRSVTSYGSPQPSPTPGSSSNQTSMHSMASSSTAPVSNSLPQPINYASASNGIRIASDMEQQLNIAYQACAKGASAATIGEKLRAIFASTDARMVGNAIYITQGFLDNGQGVQLMVGFLRDRADEVIVNACKALTNFGQKDPVIKELNLIGFTNMVPLLRSGKDKASILRFLCNALNNETTVKLFVQQGGLAAALEIAATSKQFEENSSATVVTNNVISVIKQESYGVFANEPLVQQLGKVLRQKPDPEIAALVLRMMFNITFDEKTRPLFIKNRLHEDLIVYIQDPHTFRDVKLATMVSRLINNVLKDPSGAKALGQAGAFSFLAKALAKDDEELQLATLATVANFALNDKAIDELQSTSGTTGEVFKQLISVLTRSNNKDVKARCGIALSNLMTVDGVQRTFADVGGVKTLMMVATSKTETEDIKTKALAALFHMSMYSDEVRKKVVEQGGLKTLGEILTTAPKDLKVVAAKTLVNLSLTDDNEKSFIQTNTIAPIVATIKAADKDTELQRLACMALENLSYNKEASDAIRETGGIDAAAKLLTGNDSQMQERSAKLIAKLAVNSKNRKVFQDKYGVASLQKALASCKDSNVKQSINLAINNMSVPHFEEEKPVNDKDEFEDLKGYGLGDEDDEFHSGTGESERAPEDLGYDDEPSSDPYPDTYNYEFESERPPSMYFEDEGETGADPEVIIHPTPAPAVQPKIPPRQSSAPISTVTAPRPTHDRAVSSPALGAATATADEDEKEEDHGLKKEQYMFADAAPGRKKRDKSKVLTQFFTKIKDKIVAAVSSEEESAGEDIKSGPWLVQEELVTNRCAAVIYDYYDQWCESCKRNGSTCDKEMSEVRAMRMQLIRSRANKSFAPGAKAGAEHEPFMQSTYTPRIRSNSDPAAGPSPAETSATPDAGAAKKGPPKPPPKPMPKPAEFRSAPVAGAAAGANPPLPKGPPPAGAKKAFYRTNSTPPALVPRAESNASATGAPNPPLPKGPPPAGAMKKGAPAKRPPAGGAKKAAPTVPKKPVKPLPENIDPETVERGESFQIHSAGVLYRN